MRTLNSASTERGQVHDVILIEENFPPIRGKSAGRGTWVSYLPLARCIGPHGSLRQRGEEEALLADAVSRTLRHREEASFSSVFNVTVGWLRLSSSGRAF